MRSSETVTWEKTLRNWAGFWKLEAVLGLDVKFLLQVDECTVHTPNLSLQRDTLTWSLTRLSVTPSSEGVDYHGG